MSGGAFDYKQYIIDDIANLIQEEIDLNDDKDEWGQAIGNLFCKEVIDEFKKGVELLRKAAIYAQRIDWLLSSDDGEESFLERLNEDLKESGLEEQRE